MAKNRMINTRFWSDGFIIDLNPLDRYLFLYFLTNEHTNICGIYELPLKRIADETGIEKDMVSKMIARLEGRIRYIDGWVCIKNFSKHQSENASVKKGVENARNLVPKEILNKLAILDSVRQGGYRVGTEPEVFESELEPELNLNSKRVQSKTIADDVEIILEPAEKKRIKKDVVFDPLGAEIIDAFAKTVNPSCARYYGNKTQRAACDGLIKTYGLEKVLRAIDVLPKTNKEPFFPNIMTPLQLYEKYEKLRDSWERSQKEHIRKNPQVII